MKRKYEGGTYLASVAKNRNERACPHNQGVQCVDRLHKTIPAYLRNCDRCVWGNAELRQERIERVSQYWREHL